MTTFQLLDAGHDVLGSPPSFPACGTKARIIALLILDSAAIQIPTRSTSSSVTSSERRS
jgi:hypothetical protein